MKQRANEPSERCERRKRESNVIENSSIIKTDRAKKRRIFIYKKTVNRIRIRAHRQRHACTRVVFATP